MLLKEGKCKNHAKMINLLMNFGLHDICSDDRLLAFGDRHLFRYIHYSFISMHPIEDAVQVIFKTTMVSRILNWH